MNSALLMATARSAALEPASTTVASSGAAVRAWGWPDGAVVVWAGLAVGPGVAGPAVQPATEETRTTSVVTRPARYRDIAGPNV